MHVEPDRRAHAGRPGSGCSGSLVTTVWWNPTPSVTSTVTSELQAKRRCDGSSRRLTLVRNLSPERERGGITRCVGVTEGLVSVSTRQSGTVHCGMFTETQTTVRLVHVIRRGCSGPCQRCWEVGNKLPETSMVFSGPPRGGEGEGGGTEALQPVPARTRTSSISSYWNARFPGPVVNLADGDAGGNKDWKQTHSHMLTHC